MTDTTTQTLPLRDRMAQVHRDFLENAAWCRMEAQKLEADSYYQAVHMEGEAAGWDQAAEYVRNELEVDEAAHASREREIAQAYDDGFNQALRDEGH